MATLAIFAALPLAAQTGTGANSNRLNFLVGYLNLTDAQRAQATTIFDAASTARQTANGRLTAARTALNAVIKTNPADAQVDQLAAAVGVVEGQLAAIQVKAQAKFYALLTAEQKTRYDQLLANGGGGLGGGQGRRRREVVIE